MLWIDRQSDQPMYRQLYEQLRQQILDGSLPAGTTLQPTRVLAHTLSLSRNTVENAYSQLCAEGYVDAKGGSGFVVQALNTPYPIPSPPMPLLHDQGIDTVFPYNFQYGRLDLADFPLLPWRKAVSQALTQHATECLMAYNDPMGQPALRHALCRYLFASRGVRCTPEQVIVTAGTLSAVSLVCQLLGCGSPIAMENPGYDSVRHTLENHGMAVHPVPVEADGISLDALAKTHAKAVYLTPSHQFPSGAVMPIGKRLELLALAGQQNMYVLEDDYDSEFRYDSDPIPSLQSLDSEGRVIYLGTVSKAFAPGLRLAYLVLPPALLAVWHQRFTRYNCPVPWTEQTALAQLMEDGTWMRHLRRVCRRYEKKRNTLIAAIQKELGDRVQIQGTNAGFHLLVQVPDAVSEAWLLEQAAAQQVKVYPVARYWANPANCTVPTVLLGFSSLTLTEIPEGVARLRKAWFPRA
jgi:GntR family transcriptional regulator/MocR family aminotransferase